MRAFARDDGDHARVTIWQRCGLDIDSGSGLLAEVSKSAVTIEGVSRLRDWDLDPQCNAGRRQDLISNMAKRELPRYVVQCRA
jgi:hypothetical protein